MQELNLPSFNFRIRELNKKSEIFDPIRKKFVALTPEEWVRQHFINYLTSNLAFPKALIKVEFRIQYNQLTKRPDILVFDSKGNALLLIECKSTDIKLSKSVLEQVSIYNKVVKSPYTLVTNGIQHICWFTNIVTGKIDFLKSIPKYEEIN